MGGGPVFRPVCFYAPKKARIHFNSIMGPEA